MYRSALNVPADAAAIRLGVEHVLAAVASTPKRLTCGANMHLWDWASYMFAQTAHAQGRRVAIIISGGHELGSSATLLQASRLAGHYAVSVFGVRDRRELLRPQSSAEEITAHDRGEDRFDLLCLSNGGLVLNIRAGNLQSELAELLTLVRSRYILEFPRPDSGDPGLHQIAINVPKNKHLEVHASGTSVATSDPSSAKDANVIPSQSSPATFGKRRPMDAAKH